MENTVLGILAHVDAGKTTLSEGILYETGQIRKLGRVDHQDSFLDGDALERRRGITIFSKQAIFPLGGRQITLLDTPGHVDFSSEMERALSAMDCALLVISGVDGVQSHTRTLWRLLERRGIPTVLFVNKMDLPNKGKENLLRSMHELFSEHCVDFTADFAENVALCDEELLGQYLDIGMLADRAVTALIAKRRLFPCYFGSALKLEGISELLAGLERYLPRRRWPAEFSAQVYKVEKPQNSGQITHLKITGGSLRVKSTLTGTTAEDTWEEKIDQIRLYSGEKFQAVEEAKAGDLCAVIGLTKATSGQVFGASEGGEGTALHPVRTYRVLLQDGQDPHVAYQKLLPLAAEDPELHLTWNAQNRQIHLQLMGEVHGEILKQRILERFGLSVDFGAGSILYRETLAEPTLGVGHFEPLRHYAEAHLLLEPAEAGSGLHFFTRCAPDGLEPVWQRLALAMLQSRSHPGVLTGSPITDLNITLVAGRAHPKHTEGGDFRQAVSRAVRQGLMSGKSVLLEPYYSFRLEVPAQHVGRAMTDLSQMGAKCAPPETQGEETVLTGTVSVAALGDYSRAVAAYTHGLGRLSCVPAGYFPCKEQEKVVAEIGYDAERDVENPADSIFCSHGAGHAVSWRDAPNYMHVSSGLKLSGGVVEDALVVAQAPAPVVYTGTAAQDEELQAIFERTYGPIKKPSPRPMSTPKHRPLPDKVEVHIDPEQDEYLLVDGYNIIFAWDELKVVAQSSLDSARQLLTELLCNYQGVRKCKVILVFDAYKVHGGLGEVSKYHNITIVYTKEAETADSYIERATYALSKKNRVRVATSDGLVQMIILGHGALRVSAASLREEMEATVGEIARQIAQVNLPAPNAAMAAAFRKAELGQMKKK